MDKIGHVKWAIWMAITVLLSLLADNVIAQQEFLSIDCGGKTNYTDQNNIKWVSDNNYIDFGETADTGNATLPSYLQTVRFFPKPRNKSCYHLPVAPNVHYLLRLSFALGNYTRFSGSYAGFHHTIETRGLSMLKTIRVDRVPHIPVILEEIFVSSGTVLYICLARIYDTDDPFVNAIELRPLHNGMYSQAKPGTLLFLQSRINVGGNSRVRYPQDNFDRIWETNRGLTGPNLVVPVKSQEPINSSINTKNLPPTAVMQTAWVMNVNNFYFTLPAADSATSLLVLYFAEIERLNMSEYRSFYVTTTGEDQSATFTLVRNYSALERTFISNVTDNFKFGLHKAPNSTSRPIINAYEYYEIYTTELATSSHDIAALDAIKSTYHIKEWTCDACDPCFNIQEEALGCVNDSFAMRISRIDLSRWNLTGSVAEQFGELTALITLSLDNNHLVGPLPNLSSLTRLETLHLQNNNLSGSLPNWLFNLKNLTQLFIENNNFSGIIPAEIPDRTYVKISGNKYLCIMYKAGDCIQEIQETRNNSKSVVLGITISGCLIVALAFMVGIAAYWRKLREKRRLNKDYSMILSKLTKSRAFTVKEMMEATEDFSRQIGQGGSGLVFFGKLQEDEEKDVAVKVLSSLHQFLNEVDVLSRAQHKNLVSLVGYCSEPKNLMLIYEHMSGGSLWDSLHGPRAEHSINLNWKTRLNIALDVAHGLEFLHLGCTPKIIHMDVKSANILLDSNMNAKLADFGISRITSDGEASHATMTMAKGTPGYMDPEYSRTHKVTEKSDVYGFGVVLWEIICGRAVTNENDEEEFNLVQWVRRQHVGLEEIDAEMIDKRLAGKYEMKSIVRVAKVALRCVEDSSNGRPSMSEVVGEIKEAIIEENENNAQFPASEEIDGRVRSPVDSS